MTLREALVHAIERLRTSSSDDPNDRAAAIVLERKSERLRARSEAPAVWEHRCCCGARRAANRRFCVDCHNAIPSKLMLTYHLGKPAERQRAIASIEVICRTRVAAERMVA